MSRNSLELKYYWLAIRRETGEKYKDLFLKSIEQDNRQAKRYGFKSKVEYNINKYEDVDFLKNIAIQKKRLLPLYKEIHAYVRRKFIKLYKDVFIARDGPIPVHLLSSINAQIWLAIYPDIIPYPKFEEYQNIEKIMQEKGMEPIDMFLTAEEFFSSIGLKNMTAHFWKYSVTEKPHDGRQIDCHSSAHDFNDGKNFRIKMCCLVDFYSLQTVFHEMGHIQYQMHYAHLPYLFRRAANPGFHETIGDVILLSAMTPDYLRSVGLLENNTVKNTKKYKNEINYLMKMALEYVVSPLYAYIIEHWRHRVYKGYIKPDELNTKYWEYRLRYQGVCPPVKRTEKHFDIGAKYHIAAGVEYYSGSHL
ncbi:angiotensin-converting enzyme [Trichonephila clavata]|uniref:Angiotensin-converting enzyme n=1 Tax=Trichonephila clavata TaxID=2740835 RepID=A0A8X6FDY4_TRICU|nr:angiotensin-converting enzyme [Trichonephila clavata]